ncbi:hypothetical protein CPB83DRAFT_897128 [Crepidotus variabilis]|uniref:Uncharacterized protein n=1 Tax=Crepidotus variabilis TaxID=179855 RepID=A0A9P6EA22_9AGAR|nr:hypothetical protein CPB83DRAFT_897128 [Crepidotus variabilis]
MIFAFSSNNGYVVISGAEIAWDTIPSDLIAKIKEKFAANEMIIALSIGQDDWFINTTNSVSGKLTGVVATFLASPEAQSCNIRLQDISVSRSQSDIRCVSFGAGDQWIIIRDDGSIAFSPGLKELVNLLKQHRAQSRKVKYITLSLVEEDRWFVEFEDGSTAYRLPESWHEQIEEYITKSEMAFAEQIREKNLAAIDLANSLMEARVARAAVNTMAAGIW